MKMSDQLFMLHASTMAQARLVECLTRQPEQTLVSESFEWKRENDFLSLHLILYDRIYRRVVHAVNARKIFRISPSNPGTPDVSKNLAARGF